LEVGASSAPLERDAEQTELRVMRMPAGGGCCASCVGGGSCEGETAKLHRAPAGVTAPAAVLSPAAEREVRRITRGGDALPSAVRAGFEPRFGADLSGVRVHRDAEAATVARAIGARAFTLGNHIGFGTGQWAPGTPGGDHLIAHELAHTLQQGGAAPAGAGAVQRSLWDDVVDTVAEIGSDAVDAVEEAGEAAVEVAGDVVDTVAGAAQDVGEGLVEVAGQVVDTAEAIGEKASEIAQDVLDAVAEFGQEVVDVAAWVITLPGRLALRGANALAGLLGGSVEVGPDGLIINFPEIPLFDDWEQELVPPLPRKFIYLAAAGMQLGPVTLIGSIGIPISAPAIRVFLGPGRLQNIRVRIDPMASTYEAHGEIYVGAALNEWMQTGLAARVDAFTLLPTEPPLPVQASVEAGGLLTLQGSALGSISNAVTLSYTAGTIGFSLNPALELGVIMEADLHAYINAQLYDVELCEYLWPLEHWEASEAYRVNFPISLTSSGGKVAITLGPLGAEAIPVDDIETALQRFVPPSKGCKALEEIIAELCEREILPPELCEGEQDEDVEPQRNMTALAICKCMGPNPCGKYFYKCFTVDDKTCGKHKDMQAKAQKLCNHDPEYNAHCQRSKGCDRHHHDYKCPVKESECKDGYFSVSVEEETDEELCKLGELPPEQCGAGPVGPSGSRPDLFRGGNASSPRMDNVRPKDIPVDKDDNVHPGTGGVSTFEQPRAGERNWWKFPAGKSPPADLKPVNDTPRHWSWEPASTMKLEIYKAKLRSSHPDFEKVS
jgi:hypothetical protein